MAVSNSYALETAHESSNELQRLDRLHKAFNAYFGDRLCFAELEDTGPQLILDIGCGSGAWAIEAAERFPCATVIAVDLNPLPQRVLPSNLHFCQLDLTKPLPFDTCNFDVVHARLVIVHLPGAEIVLRRAFDLLRPSGWLIVEEPDIDDIPGGQRPSEITQKLASIIRSRGGDPSFGARLQGILETFGCGVNVKKVTIPMSGQHADPSESAFGQAYRETCLEVARKLVVLYADQGVTRKHLEDYEKDTSDPSRALITRFYFTWSQKPKK